MLQGAGFHGRAAIGGATLAAALLLALPSGPGVRPTANLAEPRAAVQGPQEAGGCRVTEAGRDTLAFADGRVAYVEAETFVAAEGSVLLAGNPAYVFRRGDGDRLVHLPADTLAGAVIEPAGAARPLPPPLPGRPVTRLRAAALGDGRWGVAFIETEPGSEFPDEVPVAPWYGVFDGERWTSLERLPVPEGWELALDPVSALVAGERGLAWALTLDREPISGQAVLYERDADGWAYEVWPFRVAYVALAAAERGRPVAAVVRWDTTLHRDENSLFLYTEGRLRRVALGRDQPVHMPSLVLGAAPALSWWAIVPSGEAFRYEARAVLGDLPGRAGPVIRLDPDVVDVRYLPTPAGRPLWLADRVSSHGERGLRLIGLENDAPRTLWDVPSPYEGSAAGIVLGERELLLAGPRVDREASSLVTLLLRLELECPNPPDSSG